MMVGLGDDHHRCPAFGVVAQEFDGLVEGIHVDCEQEAERLTLEFLRQYVPPGKSPMCGNSICQDRRFLARGMPALERYFHYRNLDVSTIKELARRWAPSVHGGFHKSSAHTALSDVRDSIEELRYYRKHMGPLAGLPPN